MKTTILISVLIIVFSLYGNSQVSYFSDPDYNPIMHPLPFLIEPPDAKATAMGETGVATAPDEASSYWNPAKYAFIGTKVFNEKNENSYYSNDLGFILSYHKMLPEILDNYFQIYFSAYKRIDEKQVIATSFNYNMQDEITFTDIQGVTIITHRPYGFAYDVSYSHLLSEYWSMATSLRFIYSKPFPSQIPGQEIYFKTGKSLAADIALYYCKPINLGNMDKSDFSFGANISNIGSKISYFEGDENKMFIPTNLRLGTALSFEKDIHAFEFALDLNKLLVPTSPTYVMDDDGFPIFDANGQRVIDKGMYPYVSVGQGMIQSFYDAPNGFKEEMQEVAYSAGIEYCYDHIIAIRTGYHHQHKNKSDRRYFTLGAGINYEFIEFDLSYYFPTDKVVDDVKSPYRKTWYVTMLLKFNTMNRS